MVIALRYGVVLLKIPANCLQIRQHPFHVFGVHRSQNAVLPNAAFPFGAFGSQDVGTKGFTVADFAGAGELEAFSSSPVGFHFGHDV
jgi:hypothetical protein